MSSQYKRGAVRSGRSRRQRLAAGAVLASTTLLGTYLAAVRPQPTYASPNKGGAEQGQDLGPSGRAFAAFTTPRSAPTCGGVTPVTNEATLRTALTNAVDGDTICVSGTIQLRASLPIITNTTLTLVGDGGGDDTISPDSSYEAAVGSLLRANLNADDTLTIANLGFQGGRAQDDGSSSAWGGAIDVLGGALVVHDSAFVDNRTNASVSGSGGAISVRGNAYLYGSTFASNQVGLTSSGNSGGAVYVSDRAIIGSGNSFSANSAHTRGGALYVNRGPISIASSTFSNNTAYVGGAVSLRRFFGVMPITDSIFIGNIAGYFGGAILTYGGVEIDASTFSGNKVVNPYANTGKGGALYVSREATIDGTTFSGNESSHRGGAIYAYSGATVTDDTFTNNDAMNEGGAIHTPGTLTVASSMFSDNEARDGGGINWTGADDTISIADSRFTANKALTGGDGGALRLVRSGTSALALIESSSFAGNSSEDDGGAIRISGPVEMSVFNSSLTGNSALGSSSATGGALSITGAGSATLTNTFVGANYASHYTGGLYVGTDGALSLVFTTVYDDSVADVTAPSSIYLSNRVAFTAIGSAVGNSTNLPVIELDNTATIDDTYLVVAGPGVALGGTGSKNVPAGTLQLAALDNTSIPGEGGRSPAATSVLVTGAASSDLNTGVTKDQLDVLRGTVADPTWTIGSRQVAAGSGPSPTPTPTPTPATPPSAPRDVRAVPGDRSATVSWAAPASVGSFPVTTYRAVATPSGRSCLVSATVTSCDVTGLINGTPYTFTVQALSGAGWSSPSNPSNAIRPGGDTPAPEPQPLPEALAPGESLLQVNGIPDPNVSVDPNADDDGLRIKGDGWTMDLDGLGPDGKPLNLGPNGSLRLQDERDVATEGTGFLPNSQVDLYVNPPVETAASRAQASTEAIYVGTVRTDASGNFSGTATLPEDIAPGEHVLQATGYSPGRQARAMSLGVIVEPSLVLDRGTRKADGRHDRIRATGSSTGIEAGTRLTPWIRYNGQTSFTQGKATITVQSDGTFRWTRQIRKDKGITAYVSYVDTRSNEVFWAKVR